MKRPVPILLCLLLISSAPAWAQPTPNGDNFVVNTYNTSDQWGSRVASNGAGAFVVVWESYLQDGDGYGLFGQLFDSTGGRVGAEFRVNASTLGSQWQPDVGIDGSGAFIVVWKDSAQGVVLGRRFDSAANPLTDEFEVPEPGTHYKYRPSVAVAPSGAFVVAWTDDAPIYGGNTDVHGQLFDSSGTRVNGVFQANSGAGSAKGYADAAMDDAGAFIFAWESLGQTAPCCTYDIFARRFDSTGAPIGGEFQVNTYITGNQRYPQVATDATGDFVVAWVDYEQEAATVGVFGRLYDSLGAPRGGEFHVNTYTEGDQYLPSVTMDATGNFLVAWTHAFTGQPEIEGQAFSSDGWPLGGETQLSMDHPYGGVEGAVAMDDAGNFIATWTTLLLDGGRYSEDIVGQRFDAAPIPSCLPQPGSVDDLTLQTASGGNRLDFAWSDTVYSDGYVLYEDGVAGGSFGSVAGTATSGSRGIQIGTPSGTTFYLLSGQNSVCGPDPHS